MIQFWQFIVGLLLYSAGASYVVLALVPIIGWWSFVVFGVLTTAGMVASYFIAERTVL